jgi:hypothetical protein
MKRGETPPWCPAAFHIFNTYVGHGAVPLYERLCVSTNLHCICQCTVNIFGAEQHCTSTKVNKRMQCSPVLDNKLQFCRISCYRHALIMSSMEINTIVFKKSQGAMVNRSACCLAARESCSFHVKLLTQPTQALYFSLKVLSTVLPRSVVGQRSHE